MCIRARSVFREMLVKKSACQGISWRVQDLAYVFVLWDGSTCVKVGQVMRPRDYSSIVLVRQLRKSEFRSPLCSWNCYHQDETSLE